MTKNIKANQVKVDTKAEEEKLRILEKAHQKVGKQLSITSSGAIESRNEIKKLISGITEDPDKKYDIYYKVIQKILRKHLPQGKENKKARDYVYEEKNVYLTRGKRKNKAGIRGHDGRMGYIKDAKEMMRIILVWSADRGTVVELYTKLRDLNVANGYGLPPLK